MTQITETIRGAYAAFARGDVPAVLGIMAPEIRWTEAEGGPYGGVYAGPAGVLENVFMKLGAEWDGFAAAPHQLVAGDDTVVALGEYTGTCKRTGKSLRSPFAHVWRFKNGQVIAFHQHTDTELWLRAMR